MTPIRVALINDYELVVAGIAAVLAPFADRVEVVELDTRMPAGSAVDVVLYDTFASPKGQHVQVGELVGESEARLVVFTWHSEQGTIDEAIRNGAAGCLSKSLSATSLVEALEEVAGADDDAEPLVRYGPDGPDDRFGRWPGDRFGLSARESEVLALICQGLSNQEITERAFIGINTVKTYIRTLYRKIGVGSRTQAVLWGLGHGFEPNHSRVLLADPDGPEVP